MNEPLPVLFLDGTVTFGGAINSLSLLIQGIDKSLFTPIIVSGQPLEFLEDKFRDHIFYHLSANLPYKNNISYLNISNMWPFHNRQLRKCFNMAYLCYRLLFINVPEALKYYRLGRKHKVALLHFNTTLSISWVITAKLLRVPCVSHMRLIAKLNWYYRFLLRFPDHHIAISSAVRENLIQLGVPKDRISIVHNAIDLEEFNSDLDCTYLHHEFDIFPEQPIYGIFGRVIAWKGIREFILAAAYVNRKIPMAKGFVVGNGNKSGDEFLDEIKMLSKDLGLEGKVIFTGYRNDIPALMGIMSVVVNASIEPEPFGRTIIEAMGMSKPVIATNAGGPLDIIEDGQDGYLVEMRNSEALAEAIIRLLQDPALRRSMGKKGRAKVEKLFNRQKYAQNVEKIFQQLC